MEKQDLIEKTVQNAEGLVLLRFATVDTPFGPLVKLEDISLREHDILNGELAYESGGFTISFVMDEIRRPSHGLRIERNSLEIICNKEEILKGGFPESYSFKFVAIPPPAIKDWIEIFKAAVRALNEAFEERGGIEYIE